MKIEPFGEVNPDDLEEYYGGEVSALGSPVNIGLHFDTNSLDSALLITVSDFLMAIDSKASMAFEAVSRDWDLGRDSQAARFYMKYHLKNFSQEEIDVVFRAGKAEKDKFMGALSLSHINLYPEYPEGYAVFNIQFPEELTNRIMAVVFSDEHELSYISLDS